MAVVKWLRKVGGDGIREKSSQNLFQWLIGTSFVLVPYGAPKSMAEQNKLGNPTRRSLLRVHLFKNPTVPGSMDKFVGRHKFRVSARRKLESWGSDFFGGFLVVRTGRLVVFPLKKMYAVMSLYVVDMFATFQTPIFFPVDTEICVFHWKNGWSIARENAFIVSWRNQCRICFLSSELTICFPLKKNGFLSISTSTVQISEASTVLTLEIIWSCRLCELQKLFTIDGNNSWSPSFQALNSIGWLVLLFHSPGSPKTFTKIGVHQRLFVLSTEFLNHPKMGTIIFQIFDFQGFVVDTGAPQQERWSQWSPSCNDPPRHLEEAWSSNIDKEHGGFNDF